MSERNLLATPAQKELSLSEERLEIIRMAIGRIEHKLSIVLVQDWPCTSVTEEKGDENEINRQLQGIINQLEHLELRIKLHSTLYYFHSLCLLQIQLKYNYNFSCNCLISFFSNSSNACRTIK